MWVLFGRLSRFSTLLFLSLLLFVITGTAQFGIDYLTTLLALGFFILLPGFCLHRLFFSRQGLCETAAFSFSFGVAYTAALFFCLELIKADFINGLGRYLPGALVIILVILVFVFRASHTAPQPAAREITFSTSDKAVVIGSLLFASFLLFSESALILGSDGLTYLPYIEVWSGKARLAGLHRDFTHIIGQTRFWREALQPYLLMWTRAGAINHYLSMTVFVFPFIMCSFYAFSRAISRDETFLAFSMILFFAHFGGFVSNFAHSNYSWYVGWALYFCATSLLIGRSAQNTLSRSIVAVLLGILIFPIHFSYFLIFVVTLLAIFLARIFSLPKSRLALTKKVIVGAGVALLFGAPLLIFVVDTFAPLSWLDKIPFYRAGDLDFRMTRVFGRGIIVDFPQTYLRWSSFLGICAFLLTPFIWVIRQPLVDSFAKYFLFILTVLCLAITLNPLLASVGYALFGNAGLYLYRLSFAFPYISILALFLSQKDWNGVPVFSSLGVSFNKLLLPLVIICAIPVFCYHTLHYLPMRMAYSLQPYFAYMIPFHRVPYRYDPLALSKAMDFIRKNIPAGKKFVSDPLSSWMIRTVDRNRVLDMGKSREEILNSPSFAILNPAYNTKQTVQLLRRNKIDYILINSTFDKQIKTDFFGIDNGAATLKRYSDKFLGNKRFFKKIYDEAGITIFQFTL